MLTAAGFGLAPALEARASTLLAQQSLPSSLQFKPLPLTGSSSAPKQAKPSTTSGSGSSGASPAKTSQPPVVSPAPIRRVIVPAPSQVKPGGGSNQPSTGFSKPPSGLLLVPKPSSPFKPVTPKFVQETPPQKQPSPSVVVPRIPKIVVPPTTTLPTAPETGQQQPPAEAKPKKGLKRKYLSLRKPVLACRPFKKNGAATPGFSARLYGRNGSAVAASLKSQLSAYQSAGGSLSRCTYSGIIDPASFGRYFSNQMPTQLVRASDNYGLPIYGSYRQLYQASGGRRARFGVVATVVSSGSGSAAKSALRVGVNNALILFVDGRNQAPFKVPPSALPLRLVSLSEPVRKVLSDASQSSLKRIVDFKKIKMAKPAATSRSLRDWDQDLLAYQSLLASASVPGSTAFMFWGQADLGDRSSAGLFDTRSGSLILITELDPEIQKFCLDARDFAGCVETMQRQQEGSSGGEQPPSGIANEGDNGQQPGDSTGQEGSGQCPEGLFFDEATQDCLDAGTASDDQDGPEGGSLGSEDEIAGEDSLSPDGPGTAQDGEGFDDPDGMIPDGMGTPSAQACSGQTFGEQFACALISALTSLLQQAFTK